AGRALAVVAPVRGGLLLAGSVQMSALNWIGGRFNRAGAGPLERALLGSCGRREGAGLGLFVCLRLR
ncbi:MAG: hypothetical protein AB1766_06520, partial [Pseudomonadota bacterium]